MKKLNSDNSVANYSFLYCQLDFSFFRFVKSILDFHFPLIVKLRIQNDEFQMLKSKSSYVGNTKMNNSNVS